MKRTFIFMLSTMLLTLDVFAQSTIAGRVVDSQTGESLPYATVYVSADNGTLTDGDGYFNIVAEPKDSVTISYLGYKRQRLSVRNVPKLIRLESTSTMMSELSVIAPVNIMEKVCQRLDDDYKTKENRSARFFLRQTFEQENGRREMVEAFLSAAPAISVRKTSVLAGKHYRIGDYSVVETIFSASNLQHLFDCAPRVCDTKFWHDIALPLGYVYASQSTSSSIVGSGGIVTSYYDGRINNFAYEKIRKYYDVRVEEYTEGGETFYKINFQRNERTYSGPMIEGTLYVQAKGYKVLGFEGRMTNMVLDTQKDFWTEVNQTEPVIRIGYTHRRGFTEVEYVSCNLEAAGMKCRSIAYNLGARKIKPRHGGKGVKLDDNLLDAIDRAGYDSPLWQQTYIQRTAEEERIVRESATTDTTTQVEVAQADTLPRLRDALPSGDGDFTPLVQRLRAFGRTIPQEKVYVHMDNTCYQLGDTIWFSAYTRRTDTGRPSDVSGVLYVELYGQDGYLMERKLVQMHDGQGDGFFALNKQIQYAGLYELRAYTRWQLNWGAYERTHSRFAFRWFDSRELERAYFTDYEKLYSRVFPVYDRPRTPDAFDRESTLRALRRTFRRDRDKRTLTLTLYPEGGALVNDVPCRMAFEAVWNDGEWAEGWLHLDGDSAQAVNRGRGTITFTPTGKKPPKATFVTPDGTEAEARLPKADTLGVALRVQLEGGCWTAHLQATPNLPSSRLAITLMHEGRLAAFWPMDSLEQTGTGRRWAVDDSLVAQSGVYQMTVFDASGRVYADRLFFVRTGAEAAPTVSVQGLAESYAPYAPVSLRVKSATGSGQVSLSVRDDNTRDFLHDNGSILTEMLLASEIRGFVPDPGWFFQQDDSTHTRALDLLMLTQGWRRFRWQDMAVRGTWDLSQPAEQAPVLRGGIYKRNLDMDLKMGTVLRPNFASYFRKDEKASDTPSLLGTGTDRRQHDPAEINSSVPRNWASPGGSREAQRAEGDDAQRAEAEWERQEARTRRHDMAYRMSRQYQKADRDIKVHAELVSMDGTDILVNERTTSNGRFQIQLPPFYGQAHLFLSAADTTKWSKRKRKRYAWVQGETYNMDFDPRAPVNRFKKARFDAPPADYISRLRWPYPHFMQPYSHYQSTLAERPQRGDSLDARDTDGVRHLHEVHVHARRSMMKRYDDSQPIMVMDYEEASNLTFDAGMYSFMRYMVGDYGMDFPFVANPDWDASSASEQDQQMDNFELRFGISPMRRGLPPYREMLAGVPADSLYARKYLISFPNILSSEEGRFYTSQYLDKVVFSTDYSPRLPGNWRYRGTDLPITTAVMCPSPDEQTRMTYRDRHYVLQGFAYPAEFYSPDYSQGHLPAQPTDYRRTLYWNPRLTLDSQGEATVTFFNCARTTEPSVDVQGQAPDGTPLWNE